MPASRCLQGSPRRGGARGRGAQSLRRGYLGWIAPGAAAAAAGPPLSGPRQGQSANSQPWRGRARRVHSRPGHCRDVPPGLSRPGRGGLSAISSFPPLPTPPTSFQLLSSQLSKAGIPARDVRQTPRPPRGALSQFGTPQLSGAVCKLPTVSERTSTNPSIPQPKGKREQGRHFAATNNNLARSGASMHILM